ncbi:hypothetical protein V5O48_011816 [Marasmius crinis-equi]|uniref:Uncharacterized protein n=1 Tax=Marasmius crinis-equi TaxID=585013 RepID=A0ABR3F4Z3_9AGAR
MRAQASLMTFVFLALNLLPSLNLALPVAVAPSNGNTATYLAHDETNNMIFAYSQDGNLIGSYPASSPLSAGNAAKKRDGAGTCSSVTIDELKRLPDYNLIEQYADNTFGKGSRNVVVNPSDFPDAPAEACVDGSVDFEYDGDPKCQTQTSESSGELVGTSGKVSIKTTQGFQSSASFTTTQSSKLATEARVSASAGFKGIAEVSAEFSVNTEFDNTNTKVTSSDTNNQNEISIEMDAPAGQKCTISNTVTSCTVQAKGNLNLKATGYVWFNYDDRQNGHFKWAAHIDDILNDAQRTSPMEITGNVKAETKSAFAGKCS